MLRDGGSVRRCHGRPTWFFNDHYNVRGNFVIENSVNKYGIYCLRFLYDARRYIKQEFLVGIRNM